MCRCIGNTHCPECWSAMTKAFDEEYERLKSIGMESVLEAKEFMWDFFAERDQKNMDDAQEDLLSGDDLDYLYDRWLGSEPSWNIHRFYIEDVWDANRWPQIVAHYENGQHKFVIVINFRDEAYKNISDFKFYVDHSLIIDVENLNLDLSYFFNMSSDGKFLDGSEEKCIKIMKRYWGLKAFL